MMFIYLIFVTFFAAAVAKYNVYENISAELTLNEIAFFQTPDFPLMHNSSIFLSYNVTFFTNDVGENGTRCVMIIQGLSWSKTPFNTSADIYVFNTSVFYLESYHYVYQQYDAFNGYVFFENWEDNCNFESLSRETPYQFSDETEIIFLQSTYHNKTSYGDNVPVTTPNRLNSCIWQFTAPHGYGFKIVIQKFKFTSSTNFRVINTTDILINQRSAKINHGFYNSDNYTRIDLSEDNSLISQEVEFEAYITIVKKNFSKTNGNCYLAQNVGNFTWASSSNLSLGYDNNVICSINIVVNSTTTYLGTVEQFSVEKSIDYLMYYDGMYSYELNFRDQFLLQPHINGSDKAYAFEFVADGSFVASGFSITFLENACICGDPIILCNATAHNVMKDTSYDCPNLHCSFFVQPCESQYTLLFINGANYEDLDYIKVYSNNSIVFNSQYNQFDSNGIIYLKSENENEITVSSVSRIRKTASFKTENFNLQSPITAVSVILTTSNPNYIIEQAVTSFAIIEIKEEPFIKSLFEQFQKSQNYSIIVSGSNLISCNKAFFTDFELTKQTVFEKCTLSNPYTCMSRTKKIVLYTNPAIYHPAIIGGCFTVFTLNSHAKHCVFSKSIYYIEGSVSRISAMAAEDGECVLTLLKESENFYVLSNIFTNNNKNENVRIHSGTKKDAVLLEFTYKTLSRFNSVKIMSDFYTVIVPKNSSLLLTFTLRSLPFVEQITNKPYTSMFTTLNYGRKQCSPYTPPFMVYNVGDVALKFTILEFHVNSVVYFGTADRNYSVNHIGEVFVFKNTKVSVSQWLSSQEYCGCLFFVETMETGLLH